MHASARTPRTKALPPPGGTAALGQVSREGIESDSPGCEGSEREPGAKRHRGCPVIVPRATRLLSGSLLGNREDPLLSALDSLIFTIRDALPEDAPALARLLDQLGYPTSADAVGRRVELLAASEADRLVVADLDAEVVGLASLHESRSVEYDEPVAKLAAIVVDRDHRRRGVGEALVEAMEKEARARGCCLIFLTTAERRAGAHAFYRRIGFEETGRRFAKRLDAA